MVGRNDVSAAIDTRVAEAIGYVSRFSSAPPIELADVDDDCRKEAGSLALRLLHFFPGVLPTILRPQFSGCGLLSACEGDVLDGSCLYEVKAGGRGFRVVDLRQLLTYAALSYAAGTLTFADIGLINPRTGVSWRRSIDEVCHSISGLRQGDTLSALVEQFSGASASR
jgi:hypothetical protein